MAFSSDSGSSPPADHRPKRAPVAAAAGLFYFTVTRRGLSDLSALGEEGFLEAVVPCGVDLYQARADQVAVDGGAIA
jgi:hypothetical protein